MKVGDLVQCTARPGQSMGIIIAYEAHPGMTGLLPPEDSEDAGWRIIFWFGNGKRRNPETVRKEHIQLVC